VPNPDYLVRRVFGGASVCRQIRFFSSFWALADMFALFPVRSFPGSGLLDAGGFSRRCSFMSAVDLWNGMCKAGEER